MNDIQIAMTGNLVDAPDLSVTPKGTSVAKFRIASTPRMQKNGQWVDAGDTVFLTAVAWRTLAETAAKTLHKGQRVTVTGKLRQRNYVTESGAKRSVYEIQADTIAVTLSTSSTEAAPEAPVEAPAATEPTVDAPVEVAA
jgi:single-strand DNA-binding protein